MPANNSPIFSATPDCSTNNGTGMAQAITAAAANYDGTSANNTLVWTAGSNGGIIYSVTLKAIGTNVASVARFFINNGSANTTATNNAFFFEFPLQSTTASANGATVNVEIVLNKVLNPGFRLYWGLGTAVAAGWVCAGFGGQY